MPKLLLVEDELEVVDYLKDYFVHHGVEVFTASNGEEGLGLLASEKPDVVLLDMKLGAGISGLEFLRKARLTKGTTQIIVVTAIDDDNVSTMAKGLGAIDYVTKPLTLGDIDRVVLARLKKS